MNNVKSLNLLITFAEIVNRKSFTKAAKQLGISKSSASQQLSKLEAELGQQLIVRNTRGLSLTSSGEILLKRAELISGQIDTALKEVANYEEEPSGVFSLSFPFFLEKFIVIPAITALSREFPKLKFNLIMTDKMMDLIEHDLDVAIFAGNLPDSNYKVKNLGTTTEQFYISKNHLMEIDNKNIVKSIEKQNWLTVPWQESLIVCHKNNKRIKHKLDLEPFVQCNNLMTSLELAKNDVGIVLLPDIVKEYIQGDKKLHHVYENYVGNTWKVKYLHPYVGEKPAYVERFFQLAKYYFNKAQLNF
jgi:DNA-binding transcriptional LysR family regulator